jgi:hypothetical protein
MSRKFQQGCLYLEHRNAGPDVWVLRWRDGAVNRKEQVGTVEQFRNKSEARKACELLRSKINRETRSPRTILELVAPRELNSWLNAQQNSCTLPAPEKDSSAHQKERIQ